MDTKPTHAYRLWYAKLLRLYSKPYYERFGESMEQTFNDLLQERVNQKRGLLSYALWMFADTTTGIIKHNFILTLMRSKNVLIVILGVAAILLVPLIAMQFDDNVVWTLSDFVFAGVVLLSAGLMFELVSTKITNPLYRNLARLAVVGAVILIWAWAVA